MQILTFPLGQLQANCYLLIQDNECLIIDPGDSAEFLLEEILRRNLNAKGILATHGHFDHIMAVGEIQMSLNCPFYIHEKDLFLIERLEKTAQHFLKTKQIAIPPQNIVYFKEESWKIENWELTILFTPGHTPGSCCFYNKEENIIFTGDTLFKDGIGSYEHSYSNKKDLLNSLQIINKITETSVKYPGHEDSFI